MKILYLNPGLPKPGNNEFSTRSFYLMQQVAQQHDITAVVLANNKKSPAIEHLQQFCETYYQIQQKRTSLSQFTGKIFTKIPHPIFEMNSKVLRRTVTELLNEQTFDLIHCGHASLIPVLPENLTIPVLLQQDTLTTLSFLRQISGDGLNIKITNGSALRIPSFMQQMWRQCDGIVVPTPEMKIQLLSQVAEANVFVVPHGVDAHYFANDGAIIASKTIVLPGNFNDPVNCEAILAFVQQIWSALHRLDPEIRLLIVGQGSAKEILALNRMKNIYVASGVKDARNIINEATVVIFPQQFCELENLQVLKALAQSKAVVATSHAVSGLELVDGQNISIADSPNEFIEYILRLTSDEFQRRVMSVQARAAVDAFHAWDIVAKHLLQAYREIVTQAAATRTTPAHDMDLQTKGRGEALPQTGH